MASNLASNAGSRLRGRLEVECDLLLGLDEVLLPADAALLPADDRGLNAPVRERREVVEPTGFGGSGEIVEPKFDPRREALAPTPAADSGTAAPTALIDRIAPSAGGTKAERLSELEHRHAAECPHCTTATAHTRLVFGEGDPDAELVFVGEAPGETEDRLGRPFVGRAGEKLDEMIHAMGLKREDVYIANVLKSRPPDNRTPLAHEVDGCGPYLLAQLSVIRPKVIVCLGGPATKLLLATELGITRMRGAFSKVELGRAEGAPFEVPVMPTFHPAYLLRNYTVETRAQVWEDLKKVLTALGRAIPVRAASRSG